MSGHCIVDWERKRMEQFEENKRAKDFSIKRIFFLSLSFPHQALAASLLSIFLSPGDRAISRQLSIHSLFLFSLFFPSLKDIKDRYYLISHRGMGLFFSGKELNL